MADGSYIDRDYTSVSDHFGKLKKAGSEVWIEFEPRDNATYTILKEALLYLDLHPDRPTTEIKMIRCLSDFVMAVKSSPNGLICWPTSNDHFTGAAYGSYIARDVKQSLADVEVLVLDQKSSKKDKLARVYRVYETAWMDGLRFKAHGIGPSVEVRSPKIRNGSKSAGRQKMSRKQFLPQIADLEDQVDHIRKVMMEQPLTTINGQPLGLCKRIFNQGSLQAGGRLSGKWQSLPESDRLELLIAGEAVCEIDVKAMFLGICNAQFGSGHPFVDDPYLMIPFVGTVNDPDRQKTMRKLAKLLVSAYLSNGGKTNRFPKGTKKDPEQPNKILSVREQYSLPTKAKATNYFDDILKTFPFLKLVTINSYDLMFIESEIMMAAIKEANSSGIVAYPVHDCLMCKQADEDIVVKAIQKGMMAKLGTTIMMDVSYSDRPSKIILPLGETLPATPKSRFTYPEDDEDFEVIEYTLS
jgi:hypothetical protein